MLFHAAATPTIIVVHFRARPLHLELSVYSRLRKEKRTVVSWGDTALKERYLRLGRREPERISELVHEYCSHLALQVWS